MIIKKQITLFAVFLLATSALFGLLISKRVYADTTTVCKDGTTVNVVVRGTTPATSDFISACSAHGGYDGPSPAPTTGTGTDAGTNPLEGIKVKPVDFSTGTVNLHICGSDGIVDNATESSENKNEVRVAFDFGCLGDTYNKQLNPIIDIAFAIFRFLSAGVGLIVIGSIIIAGIQYSASRGNPQATEAAIKRITSSVMALLLFVFIFAIANFLVPGGMFLS